MCNKNLPLAIVESYVGGIDEDSAVEREGVVDGVNVTGLGVRGHDTRA